MMETALELTTRNGWLLMPAPGLPVVWACILALLRGRTSLSLSPLSALPALMAALLVPAGAHVELPSAMLQARIGMDAVGRVFLLFTALLWLLSMVDACSSMAGKPRQRAFFFFALLSMGGNFGLIVAQDLFGFYLSFALMSFSSYGLVVHYRSEEAIRAGRVTIILVVLGEILIFTALVLLHRSAGTSLLAAVPGISPAGWTLALIFAGFGIKAGALPLHVWLPLAHPAAPTPASAVLSGAMIKAGLLGWLRFLPLGAASLPEWGALFIGAGLLAAFGGVGMGLAQRNLKTVLAYSSISQMGLMTVGVGLALLLPERVPEALAAVSVAACHHGLSKGALFLGAGLAGEVPLQSRGRAWLLVGMGLPALALAGFPMTGGFLAKGLLKELAGLAPSPWNALLNFLSPWTAWGTALLMLHFLALAYRASGSGGIGVGRWLSWVSNVAAAMVVAWLLPESAEWRVHALEPARWWAASWPVALAVLTASLFRALRRMTGRSLRVPIPPGDILATTRILRQPMGGVRAALHRAESVLDRGLSICISNGLVDRCGGFTDQVGRLKFREMERAILRFTLAGTLLILVLVSLIVLVYLEPTPP